LQFPHLAFDSEGNLKEVGLDLDPFSPPLKAKDIPSKVGMMTQWTDLQAVLLILKMCKEECTRYSNISIDEYNDTDENKQTYAETTMRFVTSSQRITSVYCGLESLCKMYNHDEDLLTEYCEALDRDKIDLFDGLPLAYKILDAIEDLNINTGAYFCKDIEKVDKEMIRAISECARLSAMVGLLRIQVNNIIANLDDGSVPMKTN